MNISSKWLARAGALLVLLSFVLPTMTVSCTGMPGMGQSFSLADLASQASQPWLYLVPIGMMAVLIFSWLPARNNEQVKGYLIGQLASGVLSIFSIIASYLSLSSQLNQVMGFDMSPEFGLFLLLGGYILLGIGITMQWTYTGDSQKLYPQASDPLANIPQPEYEEISTGYPSPVVSPSAQQARLDVLSGGLLEPVIPIASEDFTIGRSRENSLQLSGVNVSRQHARIRLAQGNWFIQDQGSTGGTFVNGQPIDALRLNSGDQINIGDYSFRFTL